MKNKRRQSWKILNAFTIWVFLISLAILSGCSRKSGGTIYLTGVSRLKMEVDSDDQVKDLSLLNKGARDLIGDTSWKGKKETDVLDALIQRMQPEETDLIYVDVISEDKNWETAEMNKLTDHFSTFESEIPIKVRKVTDLDDIEESRGLAPDDTKNPRIVIETESAGSEVNEKEALGTTENSRESEAAAETSALTETLVSTEVLASTEAPVSTEVLASTEAPVSTEVLASTEAPVSTEAPALTEAPVSTEVPAPAEAPAPTEAPAPAAANTAPLPASAEISEVEESSIEAVEPSASGAEDQITSVKEPHAVPTAETVQNIEGSEELPPVKNADEENSFGPGW